MENEKEAIGTSKAWLENLYKGLIREKNSLQYFLEIFRILR